MSSQNSDDQVNRALTKRANASNRATTKPNKPKTAPKKATTKKKPDTKTNDGPTMYSIQGLSRDFQVNAGDSATRDNISVFPVEDGEMIEALNAAIANAGGLKMLGKSQIYRAGLFASLYLAEKHPSVFKDICTKVNWRMKLGYTKPRGPRKAKS